jgi:hypothetical protein
MTLEYAVKRLRQFFIQRVYPCVATDRVLHIRRSLLAIDGLNGFWCRDQENSKSARSADNPTL